LFEENICVIDLIDFGLRKIFVVLEEFIWVFTSLEVLVKNYFSHCSKFDFRKNYLFNYYQIWDRENICCPLINLFWVFTSLKVLVKNYFGYCSIFDCSKIICSSL